MSIDEKMKDERANKEFIEILLRSLSESFQANYLKTMRILPDENDLKGKVNKKMLGLNEKGLRKNPQALIKS